MQLENILVHDLLEMLKNHNYIPTITEEGNIHAAKGIETLALRIFKSRDQIEVSLKVASFSQLVKVVIPQRRAYIQKSQGCRPFEIHKILRFANEKTRDANIYIKDGDDGYLYLSFYTNRKDDLRGIETLLTALEETAMLIYLRPDNIYILDHTCQRIKFDPTCRRDSISQC